MQDEQLEVGVEESLRPLMPRAAPNAQFVHDLDLEIRRAARQRMEQLGVQPVVPFEQMVIELRKLIRLLRRTLVPVRPQLGYSQVLGDQLQDYATAVSTVQPSRRRWWMVGGLLGSLLSVAGVALALVLRRRNGHNGSSPEKPYKRA
jgi:hypothetical protein